jgi:gliding motility-associated-like protein
MIFKYACILAFFFLGIEEIYSQDIPTPELRYVSIDADNNIQIFWKKSPSAQVVEYEIYQKKDANPDTFGPSIATVSSSITQYTINSSDFDEKEGLFFCISANSVGKKSLISDRHRPIKNTLTYDSCNNTIALKWTKYIGWGDFVSGYRVYCRIGNIDFDTAGIDSQIDNYTVLDIQKNVQYSFVVQAIRAGDTLASSSNITPKYTYMPAAPENLHLNYVSVTGPHTVDLNYSFKEPTLITSFALLRSNQDSAEYRIVRIYNNISSSSQVIQDEIITAQDSTYYRYRIGAVNTCGIVIDSSNLGTNIILNGYNQGSENLIHWNFYRDYPLGFDRYEIYRTDTSGTEELIGPPGDGNEYTDDLATVYGKHYSGKLKYRVKAIESGNSNASYSNYCEINVRTDIWMPTAFTPNGDGKNDVYIPYFYLVPEEYKFLVYDRFGIKVFSTEDPLTGWDGRINGNDFAPEGVYLYHVQYSSFNAQPGNKTGSFTVFYP